MNGGDSVELERLVDYARRLPRSGPRIGRAWEAVHASERPAVKRAVATGERAAESTLRRLPRRAPALPDTVREHSVDVDGIPVAYRASAGDPGGPPVVHVHGFGVSGTYLLPTAGLLADDFPTYVPDLPGYGRSGSPPRVLGIPALADALARFMDAVGLPKAHLVGNSMGTAVLYSFARRHPERADRLVLVSPAGGPQNQPLVRGLWQILRDAPREPARLATVVAPDYLRFGLTDCLRLFREMTRFPLLDRLLNLRSPTLAILGGRDPLLPGPRVIREDVQAMSTRVTLVRIPDAAHAANYSHPAEVAHAIRCFLHDEPITALPGRPGALWIANARMYGTEDPPNVTEDPPNAGLEVE